MKTKLLVLFAVVAYATASGYYYQESSSRSSSSSYKNNELQHQREDEAYYSKRGDAEGKTAPKVNTYSQHLEYQNPNREDLGQSAHRTDDSDAYAARQAVGSDGIVRTVSGNRNQYSYQATYGVSGGETVPLHGGTYDTQSNLLSLTQTLQNDLSKQLQSAITTQKGYGSYGSSGNVYVESEFRSLESELKANLSRQLQDELDRHYGHQINRGAHSYSIKNGRYSTQANYNTQELDDLKAQLEQNLLKQLRNQYQSTQSSASSSSHYSGGTQQNSRAHTSMYRPAYEAFPLHPEVRPSTPLTDVLTQVQATVDGKLNHALDQVEHQYLVENINYSENAPNFDTILENLKEELRRNLTLILQSTLAEHYGNQEEHNNYFYTSRNLASGARVANYKLDDLNSLKQQVENNLIQKLGNSVQQQRKSYQTNRQSYSQQQSHTSTYTGGYRPDSQKIYTSYVAFQPSPRPETTYTHGQSHNVDNTYVSRDDQSNTRPAYRPVTTTIEERPIRYGTYQPQPQPQPQSQHQPQSQPQNGIYYPSSNTYQSSNTNQNQDSQRTEQLEYDYNPTGGHRPSGNGPTSSRGTYYPSSSGGTSYPAGTVHYPSGSYPSGSTRYPSGSGSHPSGGGGTSNYQTSQSSDSSYKVVAGRREGGIEYTPISTRPQQEYQAELIDIRDQVQNAITRQLHTAIQNQRQSSSSTSSYSTSTASSTQLLNELSDELKRNLTQKVEQALTEHYGRTGVGRGYSVTFSTGGRINPGNYNREQLTVLMNQLQEDLLRQLREGLAAESQRQTSSFSSSGNSYEPAASQGSNSYRTYSSGSYRQSYNSGGRHAECCVQGDDPTTVAEDTLNQRKGGPQRGDLGKHDRDGQKTEDADSPTVDLEAVPPENVETSTPRLARNKPSSKPTTSKPIRQEQAPEDDDLEQQNVEDLHQQFLLDQNTDQFTEDQDQDQDLTQLTEQETSQFDQQGSGITQQNVDDQLDQNSEELGQVFEDENQENRDFPRRRYRGRGGYRRFRDGASRIEQTHQTSEEEGGAIAQQNLHQFDQNSEESGQQFEDENRDFPRRRYGGRWGHRRFRGGSSYDHAEGGSRIEQAHQTTEQETTQTEQNVAFQSSSGRDSNQFLSHERGVPQRYPHRYRFRPYAHQPTDLTRQNEDLAQQTQDLAQQTPLVAQQNQNLARQTQDLSQQSQVTQDLSQETHDARGQIRNLAQQTQNLGHQAADLAQQTQDLTQHTEDLSRQTNDFQQSHFPTQQTQNLAQQTQDLAQQTRLVAQQNQNLAQQSQVTQDLSQETHDVRGEIRNLAQQTQNLGHQAADLAQQTQDLTQHTEDLSRQTNDFQQSHFSTQQTQNLAQQTQDLAQQAITFEQSHLPTQQTQNLAQQTQNLGQQTEDLAQQTQDLTQHAEDLSQHTQNPAQQTQDWERQVLDLGDQTYDLRRQTRNLTQKSEDLTQQLEQLFQQSFSPSQTRDLTQQMQVLREETRNLTQQSEDLFQEFENVSDTPQAGDRMQRTEDLSQKMDDASDLTQKFTDLLEKTRRKIDLLENQDSQQATDQHSTSYSGYRSQQSHSSSSHSSSQVNYAHGVEVPLENASDLEQQHVETQQANVVQDVNQHDLTQQTQDWEAWGQQTMHLGDQTYDLKKQTQNLTRKSEDLTQQLEQLLQQSFSPSQIRDLTQKIQALREGTRNLTEQSEDLSQEFRYVSESPRKADVIQRTDDLAQQMNDASDLTQEFTDLLEKTRQEIALLQKQDSQQVTDQHSSSYNDYRSQHSHSSSSYSSSQVNYAHGVEVPVEKASDLVQQHVKTQQANVVQDVSQQAQEYHPVELEQAREEPEVVTSTTEKPGFWKKVGGKISKTYNKAKDSILSIG